MEKLRQYTKELVSLSGVAGHEKNVRLYIEQKLKEFGLNDYKVDNIGNLLVQIKGQDGAPAVVIPGHMDEVGYIVRHIDDDGFVYVVCLGGIPEAVTVAQRVILHTAKGSVYGAFGPKAMHLTSEEDKNRPLNMDDMFIDIGASSREDAIAAGVKPGVPVTVISEYTELLNDIVLSKASDDRLGCAMMLVLAERLLKNPVRATLQLAFTVQEELGLRGAQTVVCDMKTYFGKAPDICIVYDGCLAGDYPGVDFKKVPVKLGKGPSIKIMDKGKARNMIVPFDLVERLEEIAIKEGIPHQFDIVYGGTDGNAIQLAETGIVTCGISVPGRYFHSPVEYYSLSDAKYGVDLTYAYLKSL